jgi:hypothetical protein
VVLARGFRRAGRTATALLRALPDFLIIGAQKGGTSSLYAALASHPKITSAPKKELHFFDHHHRSLLPYRANFPLNREGRPLSGEATPYYLFHPLVPERIRAAVPGAKLIVLLRDPVERAYSQHTHETKLGFEKLPFEEAVRAEEVRLAGEQERMRRDPAYDSYSHRHHSYLARGIYVDQLLAWRRFFPEEQMLILGTEHLFSDPSATLARVLDFLELKEADLTLPERNRGSYAAPLEPEIRERLRDYFRPHNERLYGYLGRDFDWGY